MNASYCRSKIRTAFQLAGRDGGQYLARMEEAEGVVYLTLLQDGRRGAAWAGSYEAFLADGDAPQLGREALARLNVIYRQLTR